MSESLFLKGKSCLCNVLYDHSFLPYHKDWVPKNTDAAFEKICRNRVFFKGIMYSVFVFYSNDSFLPYHKAWCFNIQGYATFKKSDGIWYSLTGNVFCLGSDEDDATSRDWRLSLRQD